MTAAPQDDPLPLSGDTPAMLAEYLASGARLVEAFHQLPGVARAMREAAAYLREFEAAAPSKHDAEEYLLDGRMGRSNVRRADDRAVQKDAARYRHLRDKSNPDECKFFLATNESRAMNFKDPAFVDKQVDTDRANVTARELARKA